MPAYELVEDIIRPYMRMTGGDRKVTTRQREEESLRRLAEFFGGAVVGQVEGAAAINGDTVRRYREHRKLDGVSASTIKRELALASRAVNYAIAEWDYPIANPFRGRLMSTKDRRAQSAPSVRVVTRAEEAALLAVCQPLLRDLAVFALYSGCRQAEVLGLRWDQLRGEEVHFGPADHKAGRHAVSIMGPLAVEAVARQPASECYVFHRNGRRISRWLLRDWWNSARVSAGLPGLQFKALRSTHGQRLLERGHPIEVVQHQLRHADVRTTQRHYTRSPVDRLRDAVSGLR